MGIECSSFARDRSPGEQRVCLGCVGSTDCAITRHWSLASSSAQLGGLSRRGFSPTTCTHGSTLCHTISPDGTTGTCCLKFDLGQLETRLLRFTVGAECAGRLVLRQK